MNGPPTVNQPTNTNEQLVGKFHVVNVDKVPASTGNTDETIATTNAVAASGGQAPVTDESSSASRFQMIRVDRTFQRGRWKVNDYEPPENLTTSTNPPVNTIENEPQAMPNSTTLTTNQVPISTNLPTILPDSTTTTSAALAAVRNDEFVLLYLYLYRCLSFFFRQLQLFNSNNNNNNNNHKE